MIFYLNTNRHPDNIVEIQIQRYLVTNRVMFDFAVLS